MITVYQRPVSFGVLMGATFSSASITMTAYNVVANIVVLTKPSRIKTNVRMMPLLSIARPR